MLLVQDGVHGSLTVEHMESAGFKVEMYEQSNPPCVRIVVTPKNHKNTLTGRRQ